MNDSAVQAHHFNVALAVRPKSSVAWYNLGVVLSRQKDIIGATTAYKKAVAIQPEFLWAWNNLGMVYFDQKEFVKAEKAYKKAIAIDSTFINSWNNLGNVLYHQEKLDDAIIALKKALGINPKYSGAWYNLGIVLKEQNDLPGAIDAFKKATTFDPKLAHAWHNLGFALFHEKHLVSAAKALHQALDINPKRTNTWNVLGNVLRKQEKLDEAVEAYRRALAIDPEYAAAWNGLGAALRDQRNFPDAAAAFKKAVECDPGYTFAWHGLGCALHDQKDFAKAEKAYKKAVAIDPSYARSWVNLSTVQRHQKNLTSAIAASRKAVAVDSNNVHAHINLGRALRDNGEFVQATSAFRCAFGLLGLRDSRRASVEREHRECQRLLDLEQLLPQVLKGEKTTIGKQLALANLCFRYLKRYRDAVKLYADAFTVEPKLADKLQEFYRYNAARCATLAIAGKGKAVGNIKDKDRFFLRQKALRWLQDDLQAWHKRLQKDPPSAVWLQEHLQHAKQHSDLASVRDKKELGKLPKEERQAWQKLWLETEVLQRIARSTYTETELRGSVTAQAKEKSHRVNMLLCETYVIDMQSKHFDTFLRMEDAKGRELAENDDIDPKRRNLNSRILFTPRRTGTYRITATSYQQRGRGPYKIVVRKFAKKKG